MTTEHRILFNWDYALELHQRDLQSMIPKSTGPLRERLADLEKALIAARQEMAAEIDLMQEEAA